MKNVSALKSNKIESPKTPGGISKSLLTPCRRLGLSRKWSRAGPSPFVSPLSGGSSNHTEEKTEKRESRKRKVQVNEEIEITDQNIVTNEMPSKEHATIDDKSDFSEPSVNKSDEIVRTPSRHVEMPHTKKSKTFLLAVNSCKDKEFETSAQKEIPDENLQIEDTNKNKKTLVKTKTKQLYKTSPVKLMQTEKDTKNTGIDDEKNSNDKTLEVCDKNKNDSVKSRSPNDLTKECMVVIQKKIFKIDKREIDTNKIEKQKYNSSNDNLQIFDSDSDELPLKHFTMKENNENIKADPQVITIDDDDFIETPYVRVKKLEDKNTSICGLKTKKKASKEEKIAKTHSVVKVLNKAIQPSSQSSNSFDDDEDFDLDSKRTILIRKAYDKVSKPLKAKSTGSITQRDIDKLRARIESKKKLLLAKAMSTDTEELRGLIKKWQKGCQDALVELMELMKTKFPDRQNMDYSEILQTLNIPTALVGYDSDNDCFNTPDDASIILSKFNGL